AKVVAICDIDEKRLKEIGEKYSINSRYINYEEMLEKEDLDGVIIATPPKYHLDPTIKALKKGLYVLLEKPMAENLETAEKIYSTAAGTNRLMVGFSLRFHSIFRRIKELIDNGTIGQPLLQWHVALGKVPSTSWIGKKEISGGMVNEHAVHVIYVFYWYAGKPTRIYSEYFTFNPNITIEDNASFTLQHENAISTMIISWASTHPWRKWGVVGSEGTATVESYLGGPLTVSTRRGEKFTEDYKIEVDEMYIRELEHFISCIKHRRKPVVNEEDGIIIQQIVDAIYRSSKEGKAIPI
ncbi:MAG TPA: Gfo/Idh/MocA family oxidoreductase, partial [Thermoproteales archaeon]|nr:Gfo/Idh/MocA family oxidoreductase [Thermoproteales archaeon]